MTDSFPSTSPDRDPDRTTEQPAVARARARAASVTDETELSTTDIVEELSAADLADVEAEDEASFEDEATRKRVEAPKGETIVMSPARSAEPSDLAAETSGDTVILSQSAELEAASIDILGAKRRGATPLDAKPASAKPADAKPASTKPADAKPASAARPSVDAKALASAKAPVDDEFDAQPTSTFTRESTSQGLRIGTLIAPPLVPRGSSPPASDFDDEPTRTTREPGALSTGAGTLVGGTLASAVVAATNLQRMADEVAASKAPPAAATQRIDDLDPDDLVPLVDKTAPFNREAVLAAARALPSTPSSTSASASRGASSTLVGGFASPTLVSGVDPGTSRRASASPSSAARASMPSSIAPMAVDAVPVNSRADATLKLPPVRASAAGRHLRSPFFPWAVAGGIALAAMILAPIVGSLASSPAPAHAAGTPREVQSGRTRSAVFEQPETAPLRTLPTAEPEADREATMTATIAAAQSPHDLPSLRDSETKPSAAALAAAPRSKPAAASAIVAAPSPKGNVHPPVAHPPAPARPSAAPAAPAPEPARVSAPAPAPKPAATTGVVLVPDSMMTVTVDGEYRRVQGGRVVVSCGRHKITAGVKGTQIVDVPCGGSLAL